MLAPRSAGTDASARLEALEGLAHNLDSRFRIPGTRIRFGWDSILGLVPGIGDIAAVAPGAYIWLEGHRLGVSNHVKGRMAFNLGVDWVIGSIPLLGDVLDVGFKANRRNVALIREHVERERAAARRGSGGPLGREAGLAPELAPEPDPRRPDLAGERPRAARAHPASSGARPAPAAGEAPPRRPPAAGRGLENGASPR
jgi:hypothetical protein